MKRLKKNLSIALVTASVLSGCGAPSEAPKEMMRFEQWILDGLARKDSSLGFYKYLLALQVDGTAEYLNGLELEAMDISKATPKAEAGDSSAQTAVFFRYYYGIGPKTAAKLKVSQVEIDVCTAATWLHKGARQGWSTALFWMSELYRAGEAVQPDPEESFRWYLAWLGVVGFKYNDPPITPSLANLTEERFRAIVGEFPEWQGAESKRPLLDLPACPGAARLNGHRGINVRHP